MFLVCHMGGNITCVEATFLGGLQKELFLGGFPKQAIGGRVLGSG